MASLPTAYASQRFGRKSLDFYAAAGDVIGADPRARADERRLQDFEGARHTVRLMEADFVLEPGDQACVLRMQPGPARRSRPVAVVNHTHGAWSRTHPGVAGLLARAGVARTMNWLLTMALFALAALVVVWPYLRAFLVEIDPALFGAAPQFDIFALAAGAAPALADWRLAALTAPLSAQVAQLAPGLEGMTPHAVFGAAVVLAAIMVHALRSWRLVWAPVFVAALGLSAMGFDGAAGAVTPALTGLGLAASVFITAGLVNRIRDAARLERRIAVLADHILRNPPEEVVAGAEEPAEEEAQGAPAEAVEDAEPQTEAPAAPAAAAAAAYRAPDDPSDGADAETVGAEQNEKAEIEADADAEAASSEAEPDLETDDAGETESPAASEAQASQDGQAEAEPVEALADAEAEAAAEADAKAVSDDAEPAGDAPSDSGPEAESEAPAAVADDAAKAAPDTPARAPEPDAQPEASGDADPASAESSQDTEAEPAEAGRDEEHANRFEREESERLRTDPRYASRAIVLPPPPPMPGEDSAQTASGAESGTEASEAASQSGTRTLQPAGPLPSNVVPIFAAPAPKRTDEEKAD
jgi:hypothetical protein